MFKRFFACLMCFHFSLCSIQKVEVLSECFLSPSWDDFDCHSSCIVETSPQKLCAVWKGGPGKGMSNVDMKYNVGIWLSLCEKGERSTAEEIVSVPDSVCWSPVLAKHPNGELLLFYRIGLDPRHTTSFFKRSFDEGRSWSDAEMLPAGIVGPTKSKPIFDQAGNMLCGSSIEIGAPDDVFKVTACWIEMFSKEGRWSKYGPIEIPQKRFGCIEPVLFWGSDGTLKMVCRDRSNRIGLEGWIWETESFDNGKTWSVLKKSYLPNPDSAIEALSYRVSKVILLYNHSHTERYPLTLAVSDDYGNTWKPLFDLETKSGEFPSATMDSLGVIHVTYAYMPEGKIQRRIKHIVLSLNEN